MKLIKVMPIPAPVGAIYNEIVAAVNSVSSTQVVGVWMHSSTEVMVAVHETANKVPDYLARFVDQEIHIFCLNQMPEIGILAKRYAHKELPLQVCRSAAGFYVGTMDPMMGPVSRESVEYYRTHDEAHSALINNTFTQKEMP